jgi:isoleucyl-tRNA synthetase
MDYGEMGPLDQWIVSKASHVFDEAHTQFEAYNFVGGMSTLNNFIVNELSGIYLDITKDRLYCDAQDDPHRRASQSAMALIMRGLLLLVAPILTYTADEIVEYAPAVVRGEATSVFDLVYEALNVPYSTFDETYMVRAREGFYEIVDALKKEKRIKSTLEVVLHTDSKTLASLPAVEAEDWFVVSGILPYGEAGEALGRFEVDGDTFVISPAIREKCPRCWKYHAPAEETLCPRCAEVMHDA